MAKKKQPTIQEIIREASRGGSSGDPYVPKARTEVAPLNAQVAAQKRRVEAMGGKVKKESPSVMSRIFDVVSRPSYAVAEGTRRAALGGKGKGVLNQILSGPTDFAKGAGSGITGKKKTNFNKTLRDTNLLRGKPAAVVGFGLDVVTDPFNFVGIGLVKKGATVAAEAKKSKTFVKALNSKEAQKVADEAVYESIAKYGKTATDANIPGSKAVTKPNTKAVATKARENYAFNVAKEAEDKFLKNNAGKVQLKVLGKPVASSELLYRGPARFGQVIGKTATGQAINKGFRTKATFPGELNALRRMWEGMGVATYEDTVDKLIRPAYAKYTKAEKREIAHAIDQGKVDSLSDYLKDGAIKAKAISDDGFDEETLDLGVIEPIGYKDPVTKTDPIFPKNENYVYHFYRGRGPKYLEFKERRRIKTKAVGSEDFSPAHRRSIPTLQEAKEAGLRPIEEIDDILAKRVQKTHQIRARKSFVNAVSSEYGVKVTPAQAKKLGLKTVDSKFVDAQTYFPPDVAKALGAIEDAYANDEVASVLLNHFDRVQNAWKFLATAVNLGHHVRNFSGDVFLNYKDGVTNPRRYSDAARILKAGDNADHIKIKVGNKFFTGNEIMREFKFTGAKSGFFQTELNPTRISGPVRKIKDIAETREDFTRLAHFIDALIKEGVNVQSINDLRAVAEKATGRVQHFNIDYGDLTPFERKVMRRAIPFYTFLRKNLPLQIESLALRPQKIATVPKGMRAIEDFLGTENKDEDTIVPDWIREMSGALIRGEGEGRNAVYWNPQLPVQDIGKVSEGGAKGIIAQIMASSTPAVRIPAELGTGRKFFTGGPVGSWKKYAAEQLPSSRVATQSVDPDSRSLSKIINYLTGVGIHPVTTDMQKSELRRQQDPLQRQVAKQKKKNQRAY